MSAIPTFTDEYLESLRSVGDPAADDVITEIFSAGDDAVNTANRFLRGLVENDDVPDAHMTPALREYLLRTAPPAWADPARIDMGARIFQRFGPYVVTILTLSSLPMTYTARRGVQVLARTNRLQSNSTRRITETAQMIIDVMKPGGLALDPKSFGAGIRSAQKVRLLHASIRYLIQHHDPTWKAEYGLPVNQEDMVGTLLSFSSLIIDGLEKLGITLSAEEQDAYLHSWNVVGYFLGVREALLPHDVATARALLHRILSRNAGACPEGQAITAALIKTTEHLMPGNALDGIPVRLMRFFIGDESARLLGVPEVDELHHHLGLQSLVRMDDHLKDHLGLVQRGSELFGRALLQGMLLAFRGPHRQSFDLPTELRKEWGVNWLPSA